MRSGVDPKIRILPAVRKLYLNWMIADRAARSTELEDGLRTLAVAGNAFKNELPTLVPSQPRRAAVMD